MYGFFFAVELDTVSEKELTISLLHYMQRS